MANLSFIEWVDIEQFEKLVDNWGGKDLQDFYNIIGAHII